MAFQQPILNPIVPFSGPIFGGLSEGKMVLIQGVVQPFVKSFGVNLRCGNGDIAFHFNPRFNEGRPMVVCNTEQNGNWGAEERTYHVPFQPGIYFEVIINVKGHCYQVSVNGQHFLEYRHRLPLHTVQILEIKGDVTVNCINFTSPSRKKVKNFPGQVPAALMEIMNTRKCYQVSVNGLRVFDYVHRLPANQVDQLQIAGDVTLSCVQY
ncbi:galectin-9-like [Trachemys scripta elegans]|uniref:galectin-9-like n=1 Tax=Trachemys scripta elegans TaxID=31138 RepID=UPI00155266CB|nr:galectin-9-like [Trachemys scripta elegans]